MRASLIWLACTLTLTQPAAAVLAAGIDASAGSEDRSDLAPVRAKIKAGDFQGALADLRGMQPSADVYNLMGYSYRKSGDAASSLAYYEKALAIDPSHRGALEYLGELYVETGQLDKAREKADRLRALCPSGCEERADLERAISGAGGGAGEGKTHGW